MEQFRLWGTFVNTVAVVGGSLLGLLLGRLLGAKAQNERMKQISDCVLKGLGLCVLAIGITGTIQATVNGQILEALQGSYVDSPEHPVQLVTELSGENTLVMIVAIALGGLIGQLLDLDHGITVLGGKIERIAGNRFGNVAEGFVSACLLFCVGSMTIVGSLNSGLLCDHTLLYTKSVLDLVTAVVLASSMGIGVLFSALFMLAFEGSITLLAQWVSPFLTADVITCMTGIGSVLIIGLALNVLGTTKLKIMNYMPAIFLPAFLIPLGEWLSTLF